MPVHFRGWSSPLSEKGASMGGPTVDQGAVQQEQQNQVQGQQYAQQQQKAALSGVNDWVAANKPPGQQPGAAPQAPPGMGAPQALGGGAIPAGAGARPGPGTMPQAQRPQPPQQPGAQPGPGLQLNPQQRAHIMQLIGGQGGGI